jgi:hypothetical protein
MKYVVLGLWIFIPDFSERSEQSRIRVWSIRLSRSVVYRADSSGLFSPAGWMEVLS